MSFPSLAPAAFADALGLPVFLCDQAGAARGANEAFQQRHGSEAALVMGDLLEAEAAGRRVPGWRRAEFTGGLIAYMEVAAIGATDSPFRAVASPAATSASIAPAFAAQTPDSSAHISSVHSQASRELGRIAMLSHEIRTPLNGMLGMSDLLLATPLEPNQRAYVEAMRESSVNLLALVSDMLNISKIDHAGANLNLAPFDLERALQSVVELMAPRAYENGLEIGAFLHPGAPPRIIADEPRLRQILINLVGNALKFTESGGVAIEAAMSGADRIRIDVMDTGVGVPEDAQARIFDEYSQADLRAARRHDGAGLGLAIVKRLIGAMGGEIFIESAPGSGSVFSVEFPIKAPDAEPSATSAGDAAAPDLGELVGRRIVVITRSPVLQRLFSLALDALDADASITDDIDAAFAALAAAGDAVLVCDAEIAMLCGAELARKAARALVAVPPSARARIDLFLDQGFDGYLIKPIRRRTLRNLILGETGGGGRDAAAAVDYGPSAPLAENERMRVLVAEDNEINALLASSLLTRAGHHVDVVATGAEAVDTLLLSTYDVVLMDLHMPDMDGVEAARRIRGLDGPMAEVPIVALTADTMPENRDDCLAAGMNAFMTKPFDPNQLLSALRALVTAKGRQQKAS